MSLHFKSLISEASKLFSGQMIGIVIAAATTIIITRILGPEGRGVYTWTLTLATLAVPLATFGMDTTNRFLGGKEPQLIPALSGASFVMAGLGSLIAIPILVAIGLSFPIGQKNLTPLTWALLSVPFGLISYSLGSLLIAAKRAGPSALINIYSKSAVFILIVVLISLNMVNATTVVAASVLGIVMSAVFSVHCLKDKIFNKDFSLSFGPIKGMWKYAASAYFAGLFYHLMQKVDILMLGALTSTEEVGYFGAAATLADIMTVPASTLGAVILSHLANIKSKENKTKTKRKALLATIALIGSGCLLAMVLAKWIVIILFGSDFETSIAAFRLLIPAVFILSLYFIFQNSISATGRARMLFIAPMVGCVANIGLNFLLIPQFGINGAAIASIISYSLALICSIFIDQHHNKTT